MTKRTQNEIHQDPIRVLLLLVRITGVEPARREALEPKSSMSANSIISADQSTSLLYRNYPRESRGLFITNPKNTNIFYAPSYNEMASQSNPPPIRINHRGNAYYCIVKFESSFEIVQDLRCKMNSFRL